jgi:hypothetical protein
VAILATRERSVIVNDDGAPRTVVDNDDFVVLICGRCHRLRLLDGGDILRTLRMRALGRYYLGYRFAVLSTAIPEAVAIVAVGLGRRRLLRLGGDLDFFRRDALDGLVLERLLAVLLSVRKRFTALVKEGRTLLGWRPRR